MVKGKFGWFPAFAEWELNDLMREERLNTRREALIKMIEHCRIGREIERMAKLRFGGYVPPPDLRKFKENK